MKKLLWSFIITGCLLGSASASASENLDFITWLKSFLPGTSSTTSPQDDITHPPGGSASPDTIHVPPGGTPVSPNTIHVPPGGSSNN